MIIREHVGGGGGIMELNCYLLVVDCGWGGRVIWENFVIGKIAKDNFSVQLPRIIQDLPHSSFT